MSTATDLLFQILMIECTRERAGSARERPDPEGVSRLPARLNHMRMSTKFPLAVHILMIIAAFGEKTKINSDMLSQSTGANAVTIRNIFKSLKDAGMISISPGPGGAKLARGAESISLWDVFLAAELPDPNEFFKFHEPTDSGCPIGGNIFGILKGHLDEGVDAMKQKLSTVTIALLLEETKERLSDLAVCPKQD